QFDRHVVRIVVLLIPLAHFLAWALAVKKAPQALAQHLPFWRFRYVHACLLCDRVSMLSNHSPLSRGIIPRDENHSRDEKLQTSSVRGFPPACSARARRSRIAPGRSIGTKPSGIQPSQ